MPWVLPWVAVAAVMVIGACQTTPEDIDVTFDRGAVRIGANIIDRLGIDRKDARSISGKSAEDDRVTAYNQALLALVTGAAKPDDRFPVIVYAHGCAGMVRASREHVYMLERLGDYVVVAPDSFARKRPPSCWGPGAVDVDATSVARRLRRAELIHALDRMARLPWVDTDNIFLIGHSQGGGMAIDYSGDVKLKERISLNGACNSRFPRAGLTGNGLRATESAVVFESGQDPWFARYASDCPEMVKRHPNGQLIVDPDDQTHDLIVRPKYFAILKAWLKEHTN